MRQSTLWPSWVFFWPQWLLFWKNIRFLILLLYPRLHQMWQICLKKKYVVHQSTNSFLKLTSVPAPIGVCVVMRFGSIFRVKWSTKRWSYLLCLRQDKEIPLITWRSVDEAEVSHCSVTVLNTFRFPSEPKEIVSSFGVKLLLGCACLCC